MTREEFQARLDALGEGQRLTLDPYAFPREVEGPVVVRHRVIIDGKGATFWARRGPVLQILAADVALKDLTVEVTQDGAGEAACAIAAGAPGLRTQDVSVFGSVSGVAGEEGEWRLPKALALGRLLHQKEHRFVVRAVIPVPCTLRSELSGVEVEPHELQHGRRDIVLVTEPSIARDTLLHGTIFIETRGFRRKILVTGQVATDGNHSDRQTVLWEPAESMAPASTVADLPPPSPATGGIIIVDQPAEVRIPPVYPPSPPAPAVARPARSGVVQTGGTLGSAFKIPEAAAATPAPAVDDAAKRQGGGEEATEVAQPANAPPPAAPAAPKKPVLSALFTQPKKDADEEKKSP